MSYIIRVDPDGTVTEHEGADLIATSTAWFNGGVDIVSMPTPPNAPESFPSVPYPGMLVAAVAEYGRFEGAVVNPKAWALYGRSPIVGSAFIALDADGAADREELPTDFIEAVSADWVGPPLLRVDTMKSIAASEGCAWP